MAVYFITGSLGGGKSLAGVSKVYEYLQKGRKIATNVNLYTEFLCNPDNDYSRITRVPDSPSLSDLRAIGYGSDHSDGSSNGLLLLDELGTWFNARDFQNKDRLKVIKHIIHLRKLRWDVMFLVQDFSMVDKQVRGNITQFLVTCQSSKDHFLFKLIPKFHIATVRLRSKLKVDTWYYKGKYLFDAYDTEQRYFTDDEDESDIEFTNAAVSAEMQNKENHYKELNGLYSVLPPAYLGDSIRTEIRHRNKSTYKKRLQIAALLTLCVGALLTITGNKEETYAEQPSQELASAETISTIVEDDTTEPQPEHRLAGYRIESYIMGKYGFVNRDGHRYRQKNLEANGIVVRNRGRQEALIIYPDLTFYSVTK